MGIYKKISEKEKSWLKQGCKRSEYGNSIWGNVEFILKLSWHTNMWEILSVRSLRANNSFVAEVRLTKKVEQNKDVIDLTVPHC